MTVQTTIPATTVVKIQETQVSTTKWLPTDKARIATIASGAFASLATAGVLFLAKVQGGLNLFQLGACHFAGLAHTVAPTLTASKLFIIGGACSGVSTAATIALAGYSGAKLGSYAYNKYTSI